MAAASAENEDQLLMDAVACDDLDAVKRLIKSNAQAVTVVDDVSNTTRKWCNRVRLSVADGSRQTYT